MGAGEGSMQSYLKNNPNISELVGVDILYDLNSFTLEDAIIRCSETFETTQKRALNILFYHGNIMEFDSRLLPCDAIIAIEVMEHLYVNQLGAMAYNLFHQLAPCVVILTTPNADFNILFKQDNPNFTVRDPDHKFEWTRKEFESWSKEMAQRYGYQVSFSGVGEKPSFAPDLDVGFCTQIAIFEKPQATHSTEQKEPYQLRHVLKFEPPKESRLSLEEEILCECRQLYRLWKFYQQGEDELMPIEKILTATSIVSLMKDQNQILNILQNSKEFFYWTQPKCLFLKMKMKTVER
jgi:hypothetical protein